MDIITYFEGCFVARILNYKKVFNSTFTHVSRF